MTRMMTRFSACAVVVLASAALLFGTPVSAQSRDPAHAAAKAAGQIGERQDGYLGVVGAQGDEIRKLVQDINNQHRAVYTQKAQGKSTIEEHGVATACQLIKGLSPGQKYQGTDGSWKTRDSSAPDVPAACR